MDIFSVLTLLGGLAFFIYGMNVMSVGLEKMAGGKLEQILKKFTSNPLKSLLLGAGVTAVIQSSSAVTVMLVGLVNSGIMQLPQTVGVIMGSNIGTTVTAWILSLVGIEGDNVFIKLLKPENFSLVFALIGIILIMMSKKTRNRDIGKILVGFAILMYGMEFMGNAVEPLKDSPAFANLLVAFKNPILGILAGTVLTGIIQSSSASVGILQALSLTGSISYGVAIPIIMGQNIGTCVTALISSIGVNKNARKVSIVHISFNLIGTALCSILFYTLNAFLNFSFIDKAINPAQIAVIHSIFNIATTLLLLPFSKTLIKIADKVVSDKHSEKSGELIDDILLATPSIAITECEQLTFKMAETAKNNILQSVEMLNAYQSGLKEQVLENESVLDMYEDKLGTYLIKIQSKGLSDNDSHKKSKILRVIGDFERLGDHAVNIMKTAEEINDKGIHFSKTAVAEIQLLSDALTEILDITYNSYINNDSLLAAKIEPLEQVIDDLTAKIKNNHINRLEQGDCTIELGFILSDMLNNFERISDHCSNIAVAVIEIENDKFDIHEYLNGVKNDDLSFKEIYSKYKEKYSL